MKNIKLFVTFVASLFFLFSCEKEKVETCGFDTIRLTESFLTEYAKGDGVDNYMIALASGPTVFDPTNQQWHTENDGWVMLISLFAEPVANLGAPEIPEGKIRQWKTSFYEIAERKERRIVKTEKVSPRAVSILSRLPINIRK